MNNYWLQTYSDGFICRHCGKVCEKGESCCGGTNVEPPSTLDDGLSEKNEYRWPVPDGYAYKFIVGTPTGLYTALENDIVSIHDKILTRPRYSQVEWVELTWEKEMIAEKVRLAKEKKIEMAMQATRIAEQRRVEAHNKAVREHASKPPVIPPPVLPTLRPVSFGKLISNFFLRCWNYLKTGHPTLEKNTKIIW